MIRLKNKKTNPSKMGSGFDFIGLDRFFTSVNFFVNY